MTGNNDGSAGTCQLFPFSKNLILAVASTAMLTGGYAKAGYSTDTGQGAIPNAETVALTPSQTGPSQDPLRYSPSTGTKPSVAFSDQLGVGTSYRFYRATLSVAAGRSPFWTPPADANRAISCSDNRNDSFTCANRKLLLSGGMNGAASIAETPAFPNSSSYMVVAAENMSAGARKSTAEVRYTDIPDRKESDLMIGRDELTSSLPEPRIFGMMLAGLGLMGYVASRRPT